MANIISSGCTATNTFNLPFSGEDFIALYITYQQNGVTVLEKTLEDVAIDGSVITVELSQNDTLQFVQDNNPIRIQIRAKTASGQAVKSKVIVANTDEILKDGVI